MASYLRRRRTGGTFFFTARLADRSSTLLLAEVDRLRHATRLTRAQHPFTIDAIAVLPAAIHTIWTLPTGDADYSTRWRMLKSLFSKDLPLADNRTASQIRRGDKGLWQRRFWEHEIRDNTDLLAHRRFIHASPVHAGLCALPSDWPHSSIHRDLFRSTPIRGIGHGIDFPHQKAHAS